MTVRWKRKLNKIKLKEELECGGELYERKRKAEIVQNQIGREVEDDKQKSFDQHDFSV